MPLASAPMCGKSPRQKPDPQLWFGVPSVPLFWTGSLKIVKPAVGSPLLLTAMSRWLFPFVAAVRPTWSSVRTTRKNRFVAWSKMQVGSVRDGPRSPACGPVRTIAGGYP